MFPRKLTRQARCEPDYPVAETKFGKLRGVEVEGTFIFRGVAYAWARRFHMPEDPEPWTGVKDALAFGPVCPELSTTLLNWDGYAAPNYWYPQGENCQCLNIWTRSLDRRARRPVMVWLHGGAYHKCSGINCFAYDGEELSKFGNVVVVNLNHRLHALGFLDLSEYGDQYLRSGVAGMADLVKALQWIRDNIEAFGGDPGRVMLFGQSGGGGKVGALLQIPAADGLFHAGAMESGGCDLGNNAGLEHEMANRMTGLIVKRLGLDRGSVRAIETIPFFRLAKAVVEATGEWKARYGVNFKWQPGIGDYFVGHPMRAGFREETKNVPLLVGGVFGEFANNLHLDPAGRRPEGHKNTWTADTVMARYREAFGDSAQAIHDAFVQAYPDKNPADGVFFDPAWRSDTVQYCLKRVAAGSKTTYNWLMTIELPPDGGATTWHQAEQPFVFHHAEYFESSYLPGISERLQDQMAGAWVSLAETGNPNAAGIPEWAAVKPGGPLATMLFDRESGMAYGHDEKLLQAMAGFTSFGSFGPNLSAYGGGPRLAR